MPYRLLAIDLDGTLFAKEDRVDARVVELLRKIAGGGTFVSIATGRMYHSAAHYARKIEANAPLICYNGAMIRDYRDDTTHLHRPVSAEGALSALRFAREAGIHINAYIDDEIVVENLGSRPRFAEWLYGFDIPHRDVDDLEPQLQSGATKLSLSVDPDQTGDVVAMARDRLGPADLAVTASLPIYIEINDKAANKGTALRDLAKLCEVDLEETIAIGDGPNDLPMFAAAGLSVAMANAPDEIRQMADEVAGHVESDGIVSFLENRLNQ